MDAPVASVLDFLTDQFHLRREHRTLGCYRSALSMTMDPVDGVVVGQHPLVSRLLSCAYQARPPQPRYSDTWDVQSVLDHLKSAPLAEESLKALTLRLAMLLALTGARRSSELQKLDVRFMTITDAKATFGIPGLVKNQRVGDKTREFTFPAFPDCPALCVVRTLRHYCERTSDFRTGTSRPLLLEWFCWRVFRITRTRTCYYYSLREARRLGTRSRRFGTFA